MIELITEPNAGLLDCPMREVLSALIGYILARARYIAEADTYELENLCNEIKLLMEDAIKFNDDPTLKFNKWWNMVNPYGKIRKNN